MWSCASDFVARFKDVCRLVAQIKTDWNRVLLLRSEDIFPTALKDMYPSWFFRCSHNTDSFLQIACALFVHACFKQFREISACESNGLPSLQLFAHGSADSRGQLPASVRTRSRNANSAVNFFSTTAFMIKECHTRQLDKNLITHLSPIAVVRHLRGLSWLQHSGTEASFLWNWPSSPLMSCCCFPLHTLGWTRKMRLVRVQSVTQLRTGAPMSFCNMVKSIAAAAPIEMKLCNSPSSRVLAMRWESSWSDLTAISVMIYTEWQLGSGKSCDDDCSDDGLSLQPCEFLPYFSVLDHSFPAWIANHLL